MSYNVNTRDNRVHSLPDDEARELIELRDMSKKDRQEAGIEGVELSGDWYALDQISSISRNTEPAVIGTTITDEDRLLRSGNICRGRFSIQKAIHQTILKKHPKDWFIYVQDDEVREKYRLALRKTGRKWCDYKTGECYCSMERPSDEKIVTISDMRQGVMDIMVGKEG